MRKNIVQSIVLHTSPGLSPDSLPSRVSEFHAEIIERRLKQANLTAQQKIEVLDRILTDLRTREAEGMLK